MAGDRVAGRRGADGARRRERRGHDRRRRRTRPRSTSTPACCRTPLRALRSSTGPDAQNLFYQGQLAMMRFWGHAYTQTPDDSAVKDNIGVAPMIGGPGGIAGVPGAWYLSVPTAGTKQEAAKEFIAFAYEHNELSVDTSLGLVARECRRSSSKDGRPGTRTTRRCSRRSTRPRPAASRDAEVAGDRQHRARCRCCRRRWSRARTTRPCSPTPRRRSKRSSSRRSRSEARRWPSRPVTPGPDATAAPTRSRHREQSAVRLTDRRFAAADDGCRQPPSSRPSCLAARPVRHDGFFEISPIAGGPAEFVGFDNFAAAFASDGVPGRLVADGALHDHRRRARVHDRPRASRCCSRRSAAVRRVPHGVHVPAHDRPGRGGPALAVPADRQLRHHQRAALGGHLRARTRSSGSATRTSPCSRSRCRTSGSRHPSSPSCCSRVCRTSPAT